MRLAALCYSRKKHKDDRRTVIEIQIRGKLVISPLYKRTADSNEYVSKPYNTTYKHNFLFQKLTYHIRIFLTQRKLIIHK